MRGILFRDEYSRTSSMKISSSYRRSTRVPSKYSTRTGSPSQSRDTRGYTASETMPFMHEKGLMSSIPSAPLRYRYTDFPTDSSISPRVPSGTR